MQAVCGLPVTPFPSSSPPTCSSVGKITPKSIEFFAKNTVRNIFCGAYCVSVNLCARKSCLVEEERNRQKVFKSGKNSPRNNEIDGFTVCVRQGHNELIVTKHDNCSLSLSQKGLTAATEPKVPMKN